MRLALVPLLFLFLVIAIVITAMPNIFGSVELTTNMTGDTYEPEYDAATGLIQVDMQIMVVMGALILLAGVILILYLFAR